MSIGDEWVRLTGNNKEAILADKFCSCCFCFSVLPSDCISEWIADKTGKCPICLVDELVAGRIPLERLRELYDSVWGNSFPPDYEDPVKWRASRK